ncbi:MAG: LamG domain-containing protein, partial [Verrucomicrobia bacterium]|nr:LamG domain-containing protein [Verrucomicrobiota bacterium]
MGEWLFDEGAGDIAFDSSARGLDGDILGAEYTRRTPTVEGYALVFDGIDDSVKISDGSVPLLENVERSEAGLTLQMIEAAADDWWNTSWSFAREVRVRNFSLLYISDPQIALEISLAPGMRADFGDLRVVDAAGNVCDYGVVAMTPGESVEISVAVPALPPESEIVLRLYYGNNDASAPEPVLSPESVTSGLVAWWPMNEGENTTVGDASGNGLDGTLVGGSWVSQDVAFAGGSHLAFDGNNDAVKVTDNPLLQMAEAFTLSLWFSSDQLTVMDDYKRLLDKSTGSNGAGGYGMYIKLQKDLVIELNGSVLVGSKLPEGGWHHLALVADGDIKKVYLDGSLLDEFVSSARAGASSAELWLGGCPSLQDRDYAGGLDDVRIYNRALSQKEIEQLHVWQKATTDGITVSWGSLLSSYVMAMDVTVSNPTEKGWTNLPVKLDLGPASDLTWKAQGLQFIDGSANVLSHWVDPNGTVEVTADNVAAQSNGCLAASDSNSSGYNVTESNDGIVTGNANGWNRGIGDVLPVSAVYTFADKSLVGRARVLSGISRATHNVTDFELYYTTDSDPALGESNWLPLSGLSFANTVNGGYLRGNRVTNAPLEDEVVVDFDPVEATALRIQVNDSMEDTDGYVLTEFEVYRVVQHAVAWVKVPSVAPSSEVTIHMIFGGALVGPIDDYRATMGNTLSFTNCMFSWQMDEGSGTVLSDSTGNANLGSILNGAEWAGENSGRGEGDSLRFDGVDDRVSVSDPVSGVLDFGSGDFTISMWYKTSSSSRMWALIKG